MLIVHLLDRGLSSRVANSALGCSAGSSGSAHHEEVRGVDVAPWWRRRDRWPPACPGDSSTSAHVSNWSSCSGVRGPMRTEVTAGWASDESHGQLRAARARRHGRSTSSSATMSNFRSTSGRDRSHHVREKNCCAARLSGGGGASRLVLVGQPASIERAVDDHADVVPAARGQHVVFRGTGEEGVVRLLGHRSRTARVRGAAHWHSTSCDPLAPEVPT